MSSSAVSTGTTTPRARGKQESAASTMPTYNSHAAIRSSQAKGPAQKRATPNWAKKDRGVMDGLWAHWIDWNGYLVGVSLGSGCVAL